MVNDSYAAVAILPVCCILTAHARALLHLCPASTTLAFWASRSYNTYIRPVTLESRGFPQGRKMQRRKCVPDGTFPDKSAFLPHWAVGRTTAAFAADVFFIGWRQDAGLTAWG